MTYLKEGQVGPMPGEEQYGRVSTEPGISLLDALQVGVIDRPSLIGESMNAYPD